MIVTLLDKILNFFTIKIVKKIRKNWESLSWPLEEFIIIKVMIYMVEMNVLPSCHFLWEDGENRRQQIRKVSH